MAEVAYASGIHVSRGLELSFSKNMKTRSQKIRGPENAERESAGPQRMWGPSKHGARKKGAPRKYGVAIYEFTSEITVTMTPVDKFRT